MGKNGEEGKNTEVTSERTQSPSINSKLGQKEDEGRISRSNKKRKSIKN